MNPNRVAVLVQARLTSARLPGKVLAPLAGAPAIVRMLQRVRRVTRAGHIVVATSHDPSDDPLASVCEAEGVACVRGPLDDVLGRMAAAVPDGCDVVVRLTGDCPLVDPRLVDRHIDVFESAEEADYVTNAVVRTFPDGLDVEVFGRTILDAAARSAGSPYDREHVTPWIRRHGRMVPVTQPTDLSALRLVLDTPADYECLRSVYAILHPVAPDFDTRAVYRLLVEQPGLIRVADGTPADAMRARLHSLHLPETAA
jgi:spore coat polysaccharide biosynthesis protein SpsF